MHGIFPVFTEKLKSPPGEAVGVDFNERFTVRKEGGVFPRQYGETQGDVEFQAVVQPRGGGCE